MRRHKIKHNAHNAAPAVVLSSRLRVILIAVGALIALILFVIAFRPKSQAMSSPEIATTKRLGVIRVGVLEGMPGFSQNGAGLEVSLAEALAAEIFEGKELAVCLELVTVTQHTARAKLSNGEIDVAIAMLETKSSDESLYAASKPYYTDTIWLYCDGGVSRAPLVSQTVGLVQGTTAKTRLDEFNTENGCALQAKPYASYPDLIKALRAGQVEYAALPGAYARLFSMAGHARHTTPLGTLSYVALCGWDTPAYTQLVDMVAETLLSEGEMAALRAEHGV